MLEIGDIILKIAGLVFNNCSRADGDLLREA